MKRIIGLVLLVLAIVGTVNVVRKFSQPGPTQSSGSSAYDAGRNAGRYSAPVVLVILGVWGLRLLLQSDDTPSAPTPVRRPPARPLPSPGDPSLPWFKTTPGIIGLSILGAFVGLALLMAMLGAALHWMNHRPTLSHAPPVPMPHPIPPLEAQAWSQPTTQHNFSSPQPAAPPPGRPPSWELTQAGPYTVGAAVNVAWGGRWIPGRITKLNPGGFSVFVQLQDPRYPRPIVLGTNLIRLK